jgi:pimeloyl-ACP methyl ester carboxylesterase
MRTALVVAIPALAVVGLAVLLALPATAPEVRDDHGRVAAGSIAVLEPVQINGVEQWLWIRGRDDSNPVLLFIHGGPGTPETAWLAHYNQALADDFVVVAWEQRGAGKSYAAGRADPAAMGLEQLIADTRAVTRHLHQRFDQQRIYLVGHSWGTLLAAHAVHRAPGDYHALVSIAQVSHSVREEHAIHTWVLDRARADGNRRAIAQLQALDVPSEGRLSLDDLSVRLKWVNRYGGGVMHRPGAMRELAWVMARSRAYTTIEKVRYFRGEAFSLTHLYDELAAVDLFAQIPAIEVPVWFVHGRHDHQVPLEVARDYYEALDAPAKRFVVFENAAHSPLFEDPERFHALIRRVRDSVEREPAAGARPHNRTITNPAEDAS